MYKCDVRIDAENTAGRQGHMINNDQSKKVFYLPPVAMYS